MHREFSQSDELWAGCIRELYGKVEARIEKGIERVERNGDAGAKNVNFKQRWRVEQAVRALKKRYGLVGLRARLSLLILGVLGSLIVAVLEVRCCRA